LDIKEIDSFEDEKNSLQSSEENLDEEVDFLVGLEPVKKWPDPVKIYLRYIQNCVANIQFLKVTLERLI
jgi:hypothetical protein